MDYDKETLQHFGVLGMHWGTRKSQTSSDMNRTKAKYVKRINKMAKNQPKYEKKIVKAESRAAYRLTQSLGVQAKMLDKMSGKRIQILGFGKPNLRKAQKYARRLRSINEQYSYNVRRAARYKKKIYKNKKLAAKFEVKIKDLDSQIVNFGKETVESALVTKHMTMDDMRSMSLQHYGVKGMKWGKKSAAMNLAGARQLEALRLARDGLTEEQMQELSALADMAPDKLDIDRKADGTYWNVSQIVDKQGYSDEHLRKMIDASIDKSVYASTTARLEQMARANKIARRNAELRKGK